MLFPPHGTALITQEQRLLPPYSLAWLHLLASQVPGQACAPLHRYPRPEVGPRPAHTPAQHQLGVLGLPRTAP